MNNRLKRILDLDKVICKNLKYMSEMERGFYSQNILAQLRNFVEAIMVYLYDDNSEDYTYQVICEAKEYVRSNGKLMFISKFHGYLQPINSHFTFDEETSVRLMLSSLDYLYRIKDYFENEYGIIILENIKDYPVYKDPSIIDYYEKVISCFNEPGEEIYSSNRYYILKKKPVIINGTVFYEITYTKAYDNTNKFERMIAFTKIDINSKYALHFKFKKVLAYIYNSIFPVLIIEKYNVAIRTCEYKRFAAIMGVNKITFRVNEINEIMEFLTCTGFDLLDFVLLKDNLYKEYCDQITNNAGSRSYLVVLDKAREIIKKRHSGHNILRYLLYNFRNVVIKKQYANNPCSKLSDLNLSFGTIPFDSMPFCSMLINHKTNLNDLLNCIDIYDREHEILARSLYVKSICDGVIYHDIEDEKYHELINTYNNKLYVGHPHRKIKVKYNKMFFSGFEDETVNIIKCIKGLSNDGIAYYLNSVESWLWDNSYSIDCEEKKEAIKYLYETSKVGLIYGAAGTGKSTLINHVSNFFNTKSILFLANTNPAVENLKRKISSSKPSFSTIYKYLNHNSGDYYDLIVIDECSTVSNKEMLKILEKKQYSLLLLVGDTYQIESIDFGNWFLLLKEFVENNCIVELTKTYRTENVKLLKLWEISRNQIDKISLYLDTNNFSKVIDDSIFIREDDDEIVLCLNYDGLYGINNINRHLQNKNNNIPYNWDDNIYKINDPILFHDKNKYSPLIYNNMKGWIREVNIDDSLRYIEYSIEIDKMINEMDARLYDFELIGKSPTNRSIIKFKVKSSKFIDDVEEADQSSIVPFQIAYAVSIHKAQGLEFNSVKILINDEVGDKITHNIFYTAITRAKNNLNIYWTPETQNKVIQSFEIKNFRKDAALLKNLYPDLKL